MADISDVESALVTLAAAALYPNGTSQPSAVTAPCRVFRGWPDSATLTADLQAGKVNVSVYPSDVFQNITRYNQSYQVASLPATTVTATVSGQTVTIGGTIFSPQNVAVLVNGKSVVYPVQANDTLNAIATGLATLLSTAGIPATSTGAVVTVPSALGGQFVARVGMIATLIRETERQKRNIVVTVWAPTPALRDSVAKVLVPMFAALNRLSMPDGSAAIRRIAYDHSKDLPKEFLYRRDVAYAIEFGTTDTMSAAQVLVERLQIKGGNDTNNPIISQRDS